MIHFNIGQSAADNKTEYPAHAESTVYTREAFRAILARQPEWKIRDALEEGNIPSSNIAHAIEWLEEQEQEQEQEHAHEHRGYWM